MAPLRDSLHPQTLLAVQYAIPVIAMTACCLLLCVAELGQGGVVCKVRDCHCLEHQWHEEEGGVAGHRQEGTNKE